MKRDTSRLPAPWMETLRLAMRDFVPGDSDDLFRLNSDPRVMRYVADGKAVARPRHEEIMRRVLGYPKHHADLGFWYTTRRDTGEFVGWFTLKYAGKSPDIEVGYMLAPEFWGQGYATEGATAMVRFGLDELDLDRVIGVTYAKNYPSQRVLQKAGLVDRGWGHYYDRRLRLFVADNPHREPSR